MIHYYYQYAKAHFASRKTITRWVATIKSHTGVDLQGVIPDSNTWKRGYFRDSRMVYDTDIVFSVDEERISHRVYSVSTTLPSEQVHGVLQQLSLLHDLLPIIAKLSIESSAVILHRVLNLALQASAAGFDWSFVPDQPVQGSNAPAWLQHRLLVYLKHFEGSVWDANWMRITHSLVQAVNVGMTDELLDAIFQAWRLILPVYLARLSYFSRDVGDQRYACEQLRVMRTEIGYL